MRASIPILAAEIRRCPDAEIYRIIWVGSETNSNHDRAYRRSLFYDRRYKRIGYEADAFSGSIGRTYTVDDLAIQAVAQKGGTLEDFAEYENPQ